MRRPIRSLLRPMLLAIAVAIAVAVPTRESLAATWHIKADGSGDAPTIAAGLALAQAGDLVLVAPGTYFEHDLQLKAGVTLASESGRDFTTIDAQALGHCVIGADQAVVRGFTLTHAGMLNKHAVYCYQTSPEVLENRFVENYERCMIMYQSTSDVHDNVFETYPPARAEVMSLSGSSAHVHDNVIHGTIPNLSTSAVDIYGGASLFENNTIFGRVFLSSPSALTTFVHNVCVTEQEAFNIAGGPGPVRIQQNTLIGGIASLFVQAGATVGALGNIIVNARYGIASFGSNTITSNCNDFFNVLTPHDGVVAGPDDFVADPQFCDFDEADYHLQAGSPCAAANSPGSCGDIGALGVGCTVTQVRHGTWGALKARYRR